MDKEVIVVYSGGMDSTTLLYKAVHEFNFSAVLAVSFDYGQKHGIELEHAARHTAYYGIDHIMISLKNLGQHLNSALTTDSILVPHGHYTESNMRITVVPNRNAIMLNIAAGIAISRNSSQVWTGSHAGDHFVYPDCRPEFLTALNSMLHVANVGFIHPDFAIHAPFIRETKGDIVKLGVRLGVIWEDTYSCYEGGAVHCGLCGTCVERRLAFMEANEVDPTLRYKVPLTDKRFLEKVMDEMVGQNFFETSDVAQNLSLREYASQYGLYPPTSKIGQIESSKD